MKPKHQRIHYARKQLHKSDPGRYCSSNRYVHLHEPSGPITGIMDEGTDDARFISWCVHCDLRIEAAREEQRVRSWLDMEWRRELFVIEEDPV